MIGTADDDDDDLLIVLAETKNSSKAMYPLGTFHQKETKNTCDDVITMRYRYMRYDVVYWYLIQ